MRRVGYLLSALLLAVAVGPAALAQQPFSDVPVNHWAYNAVNALAEQGVLEGYPDGTFGGKQSLTRYEFAQAIARMLDRMEQLGGVPGPPGPPGPPGAAAPGVGLTPEQQAMLDKLAKEFGPELRALRSDLDSLTRRVEDLEARPEPELPKVTVSGDISWRAGTYGTKFASIVGEESVTSTGYPWLGGLVIDGGIQSAYGGINVQGLGSIPITDALKDAYKAADFMTMKTRVDLDAGLAENVEAKVSLLAGPEYNQINSPASYELFGSPIAYSGNGVMDTVAVDEALVKVQTRFITPAEVVVGKQYFGRGLGLLVDNDQESIKAFTIDWLPGNWGFGAIWGMLDREQLWGRSTGIPGLPAFANAVGMYDPETTGQDNYNIYSIDWNPGGGRWSFGGTYLDSGYAEERGWSLDVAGSLGKINLYGEYAQLVQWPHGEDFNDVNGDGVEDPGETPLGDSDTAWLAGLKWAGRAIEITGEYGEVDAGYALAIGGGGWSPLSPLYGAMGMYDDLFNLPLSALHPNAAVDPHDINWIDRPLFLDATNIARGWHINVTFPQLWGPRNALSVSYMDGDGYTEEYLGWLVAGGSNSGAPAPDEWRDADPVWVVKLSRQFNAGVSANLVYGRREVDSIMSPQTIPVQDAIYAEADPIQVLRAEVCVAF